MPSKLILASEQYITAFNAFKVELDNKNGVAPGKTSTLKTLLLHNGSITLYMLVKHCWFPNLKVVLLVCFLIACLDFGFRCEINSLRLSSPATFFVAPVSTMHNDPEVDK